MALGQNIKKLRTQRGWSQDKLSEETGGVVSQVAISSLEKRDSKSSSFVSEIARALDVDPSVLFDVNPNLGTKSVREKGDFVIYQYDDVSGGMGSGVILRDQPGQITGWNVTLEWLNKNVPSNTGAQNLRIVTGFGDSMRGMFNSGDPLLLDSGVKAVDYDGVYFFRIGEEGFIKRLQRIPGEGIRVISKNPEYETWTIRHDMDFEVFGRVLKAWQSDEF